MKAIKFEVEVQEEAMEQLLRFFNIDYGNSYNEKECIQELFESHGYANDPEIDLRDRVTVRLIK